VSDESKLMMRIHCETLPFGLEKKTAATRRSGTLKKDSRFPVFAFRDLRLFAFDYEEDCAVARFCETSSLAKTTPRIQELQKWVASSKDYLERVSLYFDAKVPLWERMDFSAAIGYLVGLKSVASEKLHIEVDCGFSGVEEMELPARLLDSMLQTAATNSQVALMPEEEDRVAQLGVFGPILRARGVLWRFQMRYKQNTVVSSCRFVVHDVTTANKPALGDLYGTMTL
jgi:hypothetical protein